MDAKNCLNKRNIQYIFFLSTKYVICAKLNQSVLLTAYDTIARVHGKDNRIFILSIIVHISLST